MLDTIIVSAAITPIEANYLIHNSKSVNFTFSSSGATTHDLKKHDIPNITIWINKNKIIDEPFYEKTCQLNATIDVTKLTLNPDAENNKNEKKRTIDDIFKYISSICSFTSSANYNFNRKTNLEWKIKDAYFTYNFIGKPKKTYYNLLRGGYDLTKSKLEKNVYSKKQKDENTSIYVTEYTGKHSKDSERYHESVRIRIELNTDNNADNETNKQKECENLLYYPNKIIKNRLQIQIHAKRNKIAKLCAENGNNERDVKSFLENAQNIDAELFKHYITQITGTGKFYKYKDAEKLIKESTYTKKEKDKMCDVLKGVASYKSISTYLSHVEDEYITYDCMASIRKRPYALKTLKNIRSCGICPLTLAVRSESVSPLDNLVTIYEKRYSPTKKG